MKRIVYISLLLISLSCAVDEPLSIEVVSIASLRDIESAYRSTLINDNIAIEGRVVGNDKYGEFYNCLIIEDHSAALKLLCEVDDNYQQYPFGCSVTLYCSGLYLLNYYGPVSLGAEPTGEYTLDYISSERLGQYLKRDDDESSTLDPLEISLSELTPLQSYRYIELHDVTIVDTLGVDTFCSRDPDSGRTVNTSHIIVDNSGIAIELFVNRLCSYADAELPKESGVLQVLVDYYGGEYSATITNSGY